MDWRSAIAFVLLLFGSATFALEDASTQTNDAELILEKALGELRSHVETTDNNQANPFDAKISPSPDIDASIPRHMPPPPQEPMRMESIIVVSETGNSVAFPQQEPATTPEVVANFVVNHPHNAGGAGADKLEFLPHFDKTLYELMIAEGVNQREVLMAVVNFIGYLKSDLPIFGIDADPLNLFKIGEVRPIQESNYLHCKVPILLREGVNVNASSIPENLYRFHLTASQAGFKSRANVTVEIPIISPKIELSAIDTTPLPSTTVTPQEKNNEVKSVFTSPSEIDDISLVLEGGSLATRSAEQEDAPGTVGPDDLLVDIVTSLGPEKNHESGQLGTENVEDIGALPPVSSADDSMLLIDPMTLEHMDASPTAIGNITENVQEVLSNEEDLITTDQLTIKNIPLVTESMTIKAPIVTTTALNSRSVTESTESNAAVVVATTVAEDESAEPISDIKDSVQIFTNESSVNLNAMILAKTMGEMTEGETVELSSQLEMINFGGRGVKIEFIGMPDSRLQIPLEPLQPLEVVGGENVSIQIAQHESGNIVDEVIAVTVSPAGILDVKPHFIMIGGSVRLVVIDPSALDSVDPMLFRVEVNFADSALRAANNESIASREFIIERAAVDVDPSLGADAGRPHFNTANYEFLLPEWSRDGAAVGRVSAMLKDVGEELESENLIEYELYGKQAGSFRINSAAGSISVACLEGAAHCLDRETDDVFHIIAVATNKKCGASSVAAITVRLVDINDNEPILKIFDGELHVVDGEIFTPFLIYLSDADSEPQNRRNNVELDGSAAEFLTAERVTADDDSLYQVRVSGVAPSAGIYTLVIAARDENITRHWDASSQTAQVNVIVKGENSKVRFVKNIYERTISSEKLNKGNPLVQLELNGIPLDTVSFFILDGNPGWLAIESYSGNVYVGDMPRKTIRSGAYLATIAAIQLDTQKVLAKCQVLIMVVGSQQSDLIFSKPFHSIIISKDSLNDQQIISVVDEIPDTVTLEIVPDSLRAYDEHGNAVKLPNEYLCLTDNKMLLDNGGEKLKNIQQIYFQLQVAENPSDRALVAISLSVQLKAVLTRLRAISQPKFAALWVDASIPIKLRIPEELPENHILIRLPAYNPLSGRVITNYTLSGLRAHFFTVESETATIRIAERIDYERLSAAEQRVVSLTVTAHSDVGENGIVLSSFGLNDGSETERATGVMQTTAKLNVQIFDVDDNAPKLKLLMPDTAVSTLRIEIAENTKPNSVVAQLTATDVDSKKLKYQLSGGSSEVLDNFRIIPQKNDVQAIVVAAGANLDRESVDRYALLVTCIDPAGNKDQLPLEILLVDVNDNRPLFIAGTTVSDVNVYDNWPAGVALARFDAYDRDVDENARITYALVDERRSSEGYFTINETTGVLSTAKPLAGLTGNGADELALTVVASDHGLPTGFSSSTRVFIHVHDAIVSSDYDDKIIRFVQPPVDIVLELVEDVPIGRKVYEAEAHLGRADDTASSTIKYSIESIDTDAKNWFRIDESTGDVFVNSVIDYEWRKFLTK